MRTMPQIGIVTEERQRRLFERIRLCYRSHYYIGLMYVEDKCQIGSFSMSLLVNVASNNIFTGLDG